jgi:DNA-binding response OmpR family regulator
MELLQSVAQLFTHTTQLSLIDELSYNFLSKELLYGTKPIKLTKKEILFVELLLQNKTQVITNEMIQRSVWQENIMSDSAIKNLIFRLRKKVPKEFIRTLQGVGYKLLS